MSIDVEDVNYSNEKYNLINSYHKNLCVLPDNFQNTSDEEEYLYSSSLDTFLKLAKQNNLQFEIIGKDKDYNLIENRAVEWFAPVIFISSFYYSNHPDAVSIALSMIASYLTKIFQIKKDTDINLEIIVSEEKNKKVKKIKYKGNSDGLKDVVKIVENIFNETELID